MIPEAVIPSRARAVQHNPWAFPQPPKRLGRSFLVRSGGASAAVDTEDAHFLVLKAEQEILAGRTEQARLLLDAAYAAFDRKNGGR